MLLCIKNDGSYTIVTIDLNQRFKLNDILILEKFDRESVVSSMYYDSKTKNNYIKRFNIDTSTADKEFYFLEENSKNSQ